MDNRNPYEILGVSADSTLGEIKAAYRARSLLYHPDRLNDLPDSARTAAQAEMKALNAAYAVLKDPAKRAKLDRRLAGSEAAVAGPGAARAEQDASPTQDDATRASPSVRYPSYRVAAQPAAPTGRVYASYTSPPTAPRPRRVLVPQDEVMRFVVFAGLTSLGWFGLVLIDLSLPVWVTLGAAAAFGAALLLALPLVKPAYRRQPLRFPHLVGRVLVILSLFPVVLIAVIVLPQIIANVGGGLPQLLLLMAGLIVAIAVHWGICLASYLLT